MQHVSTRRKSRLAPLTLAIALVVAAGIAAAGRSTAHAYRGAKASHHADTRFKRPHLVHGLLAIEGTEASDNIALRLRAGDPGTLEVDVGDDGSADFSFER